MQTDYLERISISLPGTETGFNQRLADLLAALGQMNSFGFEGTASDARYYPRLALDLQSTRRGVYADFLLSSGAIHSVGVENSTGMQKRSPHSYVPLGIDTVSRRFATDGILLKGIDHLGFNLPWFEAGIHPHILDLREKFSARCLYHLYPSGEPWDFILPGTPGEIASREAVDYGKVRRPKFELVSFDKSSMPLIQIDIGVNRGFERFAELFPESLVDPAFRNIWIYLENPYPVDICLVINEYSEGDWSGFFEGCRL